MTDRFVLPFPSNGAGASAFRIRSMAGWKRLVVLESRGDGLTWIAMTGVGGACMAIMLPMDESIFAALAWAAVSGIILADLRYRIVPDAAIGALALLGIARSTMVAGDIQPTIAGGMPEMVAIAAILLVFEAIWRQATKRRAMGGGDIAVAAVAGLWLSFAAWVLALDVALIAAMLVTLLSARRRNCSRWFRVPFAAFHSLSAFIVGLGLASALWPSPW